MKEVRDLLKLGVNPKSGQKSQLSEKLAGKKFVITGTLPISRDDAKNFIEQNGGAVLSSVSKKVDFLVAGDDAGSKLEKAQSLGLAILNWNELLELTR